jgi:hypothetical protein
MWVVIEKKKGLRGLKISKRRLSLVFAVGRKGKAKKMLVFLHPALFFITPVYNDPTENEKKKFIPFFKLVCSRFENTEFRNIVIFSFFNTAFLRE